MADTSFSTPGAVPGTETALLADRQRFWHAFNQFTIGGIVAVILVVLLTLYAIL